MKNKKLEVTKEIQDLAHSIVKIGGISMYEAFDIALKIQKNQILSSQAKDSDELKLLVGKFMFSNQMVFGIDWSHTKMCFEYMDSYISSNGDFLNPNVSDIYSDWDNRGHFLDNYKNLLDYMRKNNIEYNPEDEIPT